MRAVYVPEFQLSGCHMLSSFFFFKVGYNSAPLPGLFGAGIANLCPHLARILCAFGGCLEAAQTRS